MLTCCSLRRVRGELWPSCKLQSTKRKIINNIVPSSFAQSSILRSVCLWLMTSCAKDAKSPHNTQSANTVKNNCFAIIWRTCYSINKCEVNFFHFVTYKSQRKETLKRSIYRACFLSISTELWMAMSTVTYGMQQVQSLRYPQQVKQQKKHQHKDLSEQQTQCQATRSRVCT